MKPARAPNRGKAQSFRVSDGVVYPRDGYFHLRATIRVGERSKRVRQSLGIRAERANVESARADAERRLTNMRLELGGVARRSWAENAVEFLERARDSELGWSDVAVIKELTARFGLRTMWDTPSAEIIEFVDKRQRGNAPSTRERYLNTVVAFLNAAIVKAQYPSMPEFYRNEKARNPTTRARRAVSAVTPEIVAALKSSMSIATRLQISLEIVTGARVSSVLRGCALSDLDMSPGAMTIRFRDTKSGFDVVAALPEALRAELEQYLAWRQEQVRARRIGPGSEENLFLTPKGRSYKDNSGRWGTQNKTAFNAAKKRAVVWLARHYDEAIAAAEAANDKAGVDALQRRRADAVRIVSKLTQHWFRHQLATELGRHDPRAAMKQGGWRDIRSLAGYMVEDAEFQRALVEKRGLTGSTKADTNLTRSDNNDHAK